jgi:hypothetical protein
MLTEYNDRSVRIIKGIPGHPEGSIRRPHPSQAEAWIKMGVAERIPKAAAKRQVKKRRRRSARNR